MGAAGANRRQPSSFESGFARLVFATLGPRQLIWNIGPMRGDRQISRIPGRFLWLIGAVLAWLMLAAVARIGSTEEFLLTSILSGPGVLALTYFAVGGRIPRTLINRGLHPWGVIIIIAWIGILTAIFGQIFLRR